MDPKLYSVAFFVNVLAENPEQALAKAQICLNGNGVSKVTFSVAAKEGPKEPPLRGQY